MAARVTKAAFTATDEGAVVRGKVTNVREASDYEGGSGYFCVSVRIGPKPRAKENEPMPYRPQTELVLPESIAKNITVGSTIKIAVTLE